MDDWRAVGASVVRHNAEEVARFAGIGEDIEGLAGKAWRCITGRATELAVGAVAIELRPRQESYAPVVILDDIAAANVANESAHFCPLV